MKKIFITGILTIFCLLNTNISRADTINMFNGTVLKGKIVRITSEMINIETKEGFRKFNRLQILNNRDFIEVGFRKKRVIAGKIFYANNWSIEMYTPEGILKVFRYKIRNIVMGHTHQPEEQLQIQLPEQVEKAERSDIEQIQNEPIAPEQDLPENERNLPEAEQNIQNIPAPNYLPPQ